MTYLRVTKVGTVAEAQDAVTEGFDMAIVEGGDDTSHHSDLACVVVVKDLSAWPQLDRVIPIKRIEDAEGPHAMFNCNGGFWANVERLDEHYNIDTNHEGQIYRK